MALNGSRWMALCALGLGLVFATVVTDRNPRGWTESDALAIRRTRLRDQRQTAASHASLVAERWYVLQTLDSVAAARTAKQRSTAIIGPGFSPGLRAMVQRVTERAAAHHPELAAPELAILSDTARKFHGTDRRRFAGAMTVDYRLPSAAGDKCFAVGRVATDLDRRYNWLSVSAEVSSDITSARLWGPCAFYSAFGMPGAEIKRWLDRRGWAFALYDDWKSVAPHFAPMWGDNTPVHMPMRNFASFDAVACSGGDRTRCLAPLLDAMRGLQRVGVWNTNLVSTADYNPYLTSTRQWWWNPPALGPMEWTLFGDMVRSIGHEQFRAFWQSNKDPVAAFRDATGRDLDAWVQDWLTRTYGPQSNGPLLSLSGVGGGVLAALIAIGLAVAVARRRTVS
jgi:hypothetical protein